MNEQTTPCNNAGSAMFNRVSPMAKQIVITIPAAEYAAYLKEKTAAAAHAKSADQIREGWGLKDAVDYAAENDLPAIGTQGFGMEGAVIVIEDGNMHTIGKGKLSPRAAYPVNATYTLRLS